MVDDINIHLHNSLNESSTTNTFKTQYKENCVNEENVFRRTVYNKYLAIRDWDISKFTFLKCDNTLNYNDKINFATKIVTELNIKIDKDNIHKDSYLLFLEYAKQINDEELYKVYETIIENNINGINIFTIQSNNFGDSINKTFWGNLTKNKIYNNNSNIHYVTTGSIMNLINEKSIIFGTGFISKNGDIGGGNYNSNSNMKYKTPHKIIAVRGPLTRNKMMEFGIDCPENYGDPLILMPCINDYYKNIDDDIVGIIPHYIDKNNNNYNLLKTNLEQNGFKVKYIDIEVGTNHSKLIEEITPTEKKNETKQYKDK